jgi:hypothetical protein
MNLDAAAAPVDRQNAFMPDLPTRKVDQHTSGLKSLGSYSFHGHLLNPPMLTTPGVFTYTHAMQENFSGNPARYVATRAQYSSFDAEPGNVRYTLEVGIRPIAGHASSEESRCFAYLEVRTRDPQQAAQLHQAAVELWSNARQAPNVIAALVLERASAFQLTILTPHVLGNFPIERSLDQVTIGRTVPRLDSEPEEAEGAGV